MEPINNSIICMFIGLFIDLMGIIELMNRFLGQDYKEQRKIELTVYKSIHFQEKLGIDVSLIWK